MTDEGGRSGVVEAPIPTKGLRPLSTDVQVGSERSVSRSSLGARSEASQSTPLVLIETGGALETTTEEL